MRPKQRQFDPICMGICLCARRRADLFVPLNAPSSSRLIVLQIPSSLTTAELQAHFSELELPITDAKVLSNKGGQARRIGFVGFRTHADAQTAKDWFDGTWMRGTRIRVEYAQAVSIEQGLINRKAHLGTPDDTAYSDSRWTAASKAPSHRARQSCQRIYVRRESSRSQSRRNAVRWEGDFADAWWSCRSQNL